MTTEEKIYLYPLWLRIWHGVNALGIIILIISGICMQYSNPSFTILNFNLAVQLHNISGIFVACFYLVFIFGNFFTINRKYYRIKPKGLRKRIRRQVNFYFWGMFKNHILPYPISEKRKFNPLQKYSYVVIMYFFMPVIIITGIALLFPEIIVEKIYMLSGIFLTAIIHTILGYLISIFLLIHIYVATIGKSPLANFKSIITGWHG